MIAQAVELLERHGYRAHRGGGFHKVLPPCFGSSPKTPWIVDGKKIRRELRFVREHPERALALAALARMDPRKAFELWREIGPRGRSASEVMP